MVSKGLRSRVRDRHESEAAVKCQDVNCLRQAKPGSKWCSDICAPTEPRATAAMTSVRTMASLDAEALGDLSEESSDEDDTGPSESEIEEPTQRSSLYSGHGGESTRKEDRERPIELSARARRSETESEKRPGETVTRNIMSEGERGMQKIESEKSETFLDDETPMIRQGSSTALAESSNPEALDSTSLIGESIKDLRSMMKSVAEHVRSKTGVDGSARLDPLIINAGSNCAKNISGLMRLQLDFMKFRHESKAKK